MLLLLTSALEFGSRILLNQLTERNFSFLLRVVVAKVLLLEIIENIEDMM